MQAGNSLGNNLVGSFVKRESERLGLAYTSKFEDETGMLIAKLIRPSNNLRKRNKNHANFFAGLS